MTIEKVGAVWVWDIDRTESVSRMVAVDVMEALGHRGEDFKTRDRVITAIDSRLNFILDEVACASGCAEDSEGDV